VVDLNTLAAVGLLYDIVGVIILGLSLAATSDVNIKRQAGTYYNFNSSVLTTLVEQRTDARFGLFLLVLGFLFQFFFAIGIAIEDATKNLLLIALVLVVLFYVVVRKPLVKRIASKLRESLLKAKD
jgi:hypothetical protein